MMRRSLHNALRCSNRCLTRSAAFHHLPTSSSRCFATAHRTSNFPDFGEPHCAWVVCVCNHRLHDDVILACRPTHVPSTRIAILRPIKMISISKQSFSAGKYFVSPMTRSNDSGRYTALVSIRNGSHDRVFRFLPQFSSREEAIDYAIGEAHTWLRQRAA